LNNQGRVLLGDFGSSRKLTGKEEELTANLVTRFYRAPELLYGSKKYNKSVDLWSLGCVIAELYMMDNQFLFPGANELD
jgi:serine/threonine protein kinase